MTKPIRAVAFDMDGTMANSEDVYEHVGTETLRRRGHEFTDELRHRMMGQPAAQALAVMIAHHGLSDTIEALEVEGEELFWEIAHTILKPMPAVREFLSAVDGAGLPRCVVTSGSRRYADRILGEIGLDGFQFKITADDVTNGKPHPEPYLLAAERFGVAPDEMLVLEDSGNGCKSGVAAGAVTVALPNHHTAGHDFSGATLVADTLADPAIRGLLKLS
ncbi:Phosphorylated carbohydrates phosphatase [Posidoniimonas polymericola]|uniref:Phosphorylated carbohydrates phosphatase n=1 Tax=Posidoniimonas polymericola TaxID=2528002 RepID=A0A5C5Y0F8_9BACT|nr:HAD family phosphatase [Posidoniimonas polymericola]TWT67725.1 Phosphorylated carbohydrates phosphatase [Posidoniimonas polymericola]